ncbi:TetR family transcriptional regulator [Betaproteobacteria bacterium]|nr:TetR family transcriptional regulator [Betaproteobacteria bacterium]
MRDHILETAARLFYENGIRAVGVDRVIAEANIAKATLFRHFATKELLVVAYLQARSERVQASLREVMANAGKSPQKRIVALFHALEESARTQPFRGCAFMLAVAELEESQAIKSVARTHKDAVKALILEALEQPDAAGRRLAEQLALLYDGALASILVYRDPRAAKFAASAALSLFPAPVH